MDYLDRLGAALSSFSEGHRLTPDQRDLLLHAARSEVENALDIYFPRGVVRTITLRAYDNFKKSEERTVGVSPVVTLI